MTTITAKKQSTRTKIRIFNLMVVVMQLFSMLCHHNLTPLAHRANEPLNVHLRDGILLSTGRQNVPHGVKVHPRMTRSWMAMCPGNLMKPRLE